MTKTKKKKRHLKKWVKICLSILIILAFIIFGYKMHNKFYSINNKYNKFKIKKETEQKKSTKEEPQENLERYTYKDGFYSENLSNIIKEKITGHSYPKDFDKKYTKISYDQLAYLKLKYKDFSGNNHDDGEMIVNKEVAKEVLEIFYELYSNNYPIEKINLVEKYNASDELSMKDNNTSAFNYRINENDDKLSWHCFGLAIDINPLYNPYILENELYPSTATKYVDREKEFPGKIDHDDLAYKIFLKYGWKWGGDFINSKDYQHFYKEIYDTSVREKRGE